MAGTLPHWVDADFLRTASGVLVVVATIVVVAVVFLVRSVGTRLVVVALLAAAVFGLLHYRQTLEHCDETGCPCKLFGEEVRGAACNQPGANHAARPSLPNADAIARTVTRR